MRNLRVELQRRHAPVRRLKAGHRAALAARRDLEAHGEPLYLIPVAHPDRKFFIAAAARKKTSLFYVDRRAAIFRGAAALHRAAELVRQQLHTVAYPQHGGIGGQQLHRDRRRVRIKHAARSAGNYNSRRIGLTELLYRRIPEKYLAVDAKLAHASCDQLCIL